MQIRDYKKLTAWTPVLADVIGAMNIRDLALFIESEQIAAIKRGVPETADDIMNRLSAKI